MAEQLQLVRRDDFTADIDSLDLLSLFKMDGDGWEQSAASAGDESVEEVMTFHVPGTSHNNLASVVQSLDEKIEQVEWYRDAVERYGVWLRAKLDGETTARQALVMRAVRGRAEVRSPFARHEFILPRYRLGLERTPWWEALTYATLSGEPLNCLGSVNTYSAGLVVGDIDARMARIEFMGTPGGGGPVYKCWLGFRSSRWGTPANFQSKWECELGTVGTDTATSTAEDTTASGVTPKIMRCTFATNATMQPRVTVRMEVVMGANYADQRGHFLVLLRAKCTDGTTVANVRLLNGWGGQTAWQTNDRIRVSGTSWNLYEMGKIQIPLHGHLFGDFDDPRSYSLRLEAERVAGTGSLDLDVLLLIPVGEGFVFAEGGEVQYVTSPGVSFQPMTIQHRPDGRIDTAGYDVLYDGPYFTVNAQVLGGIPVGAGAAVLAGQRQASSVLADAIGLNIRFFPRWATLRGAE